MTRHATPSDYARLGVEPLATSAEIKSAFRKLALRYHPDRHPDDPGAVRQFRLVVESYEAILRGPAPGVESQAPRHAARPAPVPVAPRPLAALDIGDVVWADYDAVLVSPDRTVYLDPAAPGRAHVDRSLQVRVVRAADGYSVAIAAHCRHLWSVSPRAASIGLAIAHLDTGNDSNGVRLPSRFIDATIGTMRDGDRGWTVASALVVLADGRCYIDEREHINAQPTLTTPLRVERRAGGWHVVGDGHPRQWAAQARAATPHHVTVTSATLGGVPVRPASD